MVALTDIILPVVLLGTGIFLTLRLRLVQVRYLLQGIKNMLPKKNCEHGGTSPFRALMTSLAAQLGTGNIVGAGTAIILGGPGAVFWMWVSAFVGMATAYSEAVLAVITRKSSGKTGFFGGAVYYISYAFKGRVGAVLSSLFSLFATTALGFTGVAVQSNSIAAAMSEAFSVPVWLTGATVAVLSGIFIMKGADAISAFAEKTVPVFACLYMAGCVAVILFNADRLPFAAGLIFRCAFTPSAVLGGTAGEALRRAVTQGIKKGLFTNEAGMGSTASAHAMSNTPSPHFQGTLAVAGVFIDTFVMLTLTALAVITVLYKDGGIPDPTYSGSQAVTTALADVLSQRPAEIFVALSVLFFAFASILGWSISGKISAEYLFGSKCRKIYVISSLIFVFLGCVTPCNLVWTLTDLFNALMVLTNVPALIKLSPVTAAQENKKKRAICEF